MDFLKLTFYDNTITIWIAAVVVFFLTVVVINLLKKLLVKKLSQFAQTTETQLDDLVVELARKTRFLIILILALYAGSLALKFPENLTDIFRTIAILAFLAQAALWGNVAIDFLMKYLIEKKMKGDASNVTMMAYLGFMGKLALWSVVLLLGLDNLGIDVTALIAGLGVGGIAIALASQKVLEDLFSSLSIVFDKPFVPGDFIIVDDLLGTVEQIGLKTTRVRSLSGEQLVFSNTDLLQSRIRNYKRMFERRVTLKIGVTYQTQYEKMVQIPKFIEEAIGTQKHARFDRAHFKEYGDFSLNFEAVYYIKSPDYNTYMDIQQAINLWIYKRFGEEKIDFAYPTQTLFVQKE